MASTRRINLHELLRKGTYDHAVVCTYTFDPAFFEEYCLDRLGALARTPSISVLIDEAIYEDVITSEHSRPGQANIRYLLSPVRAAGCFHTKLTLLIGRKRSRLILGSANFTRPGLTSNAEMAAAFDRDSEAPDSEIEALFADAFHYLRALSARLGNESMRSNLQAIGRDAPWILGSNQDGRRCRIIHNLARPIWSQLVDAVSVPVATLDVVSPFFDAEPALLETAFRELKPEQIRIFTENGNTTLTTRWLETPEFIDGRLEVHSIGVQDEGHLQPLHAKLLKLSTDAGVTLLYGSPNFTRPGLARTIDNGNAELALLVTGIEESATLNCLLDPAGNAKRLRAAHELRSGRTDEPSPGGAKGRRIRLFEAIEAEDHVRVRAAPDDDLAFEVLTGEIDFHEGSAASEPLVYLSESVWKLPVSRAIARRLDAGSAVLSLVASLDSQQVGTSNPLLVTSLKEFKTGQNLRRSRHVREAQEGIDQFLSVLNELLEGSDEDALLVFLNYCDIPVLEASRPSLLRHDRSRWDGSAGMKALGTRNLAVYRELHEASIAFVERHLKKLEQHVEQGSLAGVSNYLHIFQAIGGILRTQLERILLGLESGDSIIKTDDWFDVRSHINQYYRAFRDLSMCLYERYVPRLVDDYGVESVREQFRDELNSLQDLRVNMFEFRERLEAVRIAALKVRTPIGTLVDAAYPGTPRCVFEEHRWSSYRDELAYSAWQQEQLIA